MALNSVVLPAPLGPIRLVTFPGSRSRSASSTAVTPPKRFVTAHTRRIGAAAVVAPGAALSHVWLVAAAHQGANKGVPTRNEKRNHALVGG